MSKICKHFYITGLVQGVFYRNWTKQKAEALNLEGWVKNLPDGRVEVVACGDQEKLAEFEAWLWEGSPTSEVSNVVSQEKELKDYDGFVIVR